MYKTTEQCDSHIKTGIMSVENTSNRKRKQQTAEQCDCWLKEAQENAQAKRAEETTEQCDHQLEEA